MACTEEMAKMQLAQSAAIRESYKSEEYDTKHSDIRQWLDVMNEVNEAFQKTPDTGCSYRQKILFDCIHSSMYLASDNLSLDNMLDLVMQLASAMDCACEREQEIVDYRSAISMLFKKWFEIRESVTCGLIKSEINKWQSSKNNRNRTNDVKRMVLRKIVSFLLDDSADFLEETVSEYELENEEIDLDFTIVLKSLLEAKSMFRKRYIGFRQYGLMEVCDGRICFDHDDEEPFLIMKARNTRSFLKAYYSMKLYVEYLQKMANVSVPEWGIFAEKPLLSGGQKCDIKIESEDIRQPEKTAAFVNIIRKDVLSFIQNRNNQQLWAMVVFIMRKKGFFTYAITMDSASKIFKQICPDEIESADKLKRNMYKFTSTRDLEFRQYDKLPNTDPIKRVGMEIEQMFEDF